MAVKSVAVLGAGHGGCAAAADLSKRGYSVGQGLMKLKVVDAHGNLIPTGTAVLRLLCTVGLQFVPVVGGFLDLLWPLWDKERQTLHDKAVGTYVIKTG